MTTAAAENANEAEPTEEVKVKMRKELQKQYNKVKRKLKLRSKSELIAMIWEQGMAYKELQGISQQLFEEVKELKNKGEKSEEHEDNN